MSKRAVILRHVLPVIALLLGGSAAAQTGRTAVVGQVMDSSGQQPLAGAEVAIVGAGGVTLRQSSDGGLLRSSVQPPATEPLASSVTARRQIASAVA